MDGLAPVFIVLARGFPYCLDALHVAQLVEDAIAAKSYEIVVVFYFEAFNIWSSDYDFGIATVLHTLGFDVAECPRD